MKTSPRTQAHPRLGASGGVLRPTLLASAIALALAAPGTAVPRELPLHEARLALLREGQILANTAATVLAARATDRDNDGTLEPPAMRDAWGPTSRIGQLPAGFGVPQADGYGTPLGYCAFDNGSTTSGANLVPGTLNGGRLLAVVFAGADRTLQTTCADIAAGSTRGDDFVSVRDTSQTLLSAGVSLTRPPVLNAAALTNLITGRSDDVIDTPNDPLLNGELRLTTADNRLWRFEAGSPLSAQRPNGRREGRFVAVVADVMPVGPGDVTEFENLLVRGNLQVNGASSLIGGATVGAVGASARLQVLGTGGLLVDGAPGSANVRLGALAGLAAPVAPPGFDRLVIADAEGRLNQASLESLVGSVVGSLGNVWTTRGNANTDPGVNFLGTLDAQDLVIRTNNLERVRIAATTGAAQFTGPLRGSAGLDITGAALLRSGALIGSASASERALVLQGAAGQAANLLEARSAANELVLSIGPGGAVVAAGSVQTPLVSTGRVEAAGLLNLGAADASSTPAQVQLSIAGQTRLSVNATGTLVSAEGLTVAGTPGTSNIRLQALGGTANALLPASSFDRVVVANSSGQLQQVTPAGLLNNSVWLLSGNAGTVSAGALGEAASGSFVGTRDATDLRLATQGTVRLIVSAEGAVSTQRDLLVNGLTVGRGGGNRDDNAAFGLGALGQATTGGSNVAMGRLALGAVVGGTGNTAVGDRALATVSGQGGNVAVGTDALTRSTAANATAVGFGALQANTTGDGGTAVGYLALGANTDGSGGTALGNLALRANTSGDGNTAVGERALQSNTTGSLNVAIGQNALGGLDGNQTGSRNVALGVNAGRYLGNENQNAAGNNSVYIGAFSRGIADPAQTNQIVIGYEATGLGSNSVVLGNAQIALTALRGLVGVNTTGPTAQLSVQSANAGRVALLSRGASGQTASLFEAQASDGRVVASIASGGSARFAGLTVEGMAGTPNVALASLGGDVNLGLPPGFDRVVVADAQGRLQQVSPGQLIQNNVWLSSGNAGTTGAGALGAVATGSRLGTLDAADLRIVTNGRVRAIVSSNGAISTEQDLTVNGLTVGRGGGNRPGNVALGSGALSANTIGTSNLAIGGDALRSAVSARENIALGANALASAVSSWANVAVGYSALANATTVGSTAIGHSALRDNTSGTGGTAVGSQSLMRNITGSNNTALGSLSLGSNTTGRGNVAIGQAALGGETGNVVGSLNVGVGVEAGRFVNVGGVMAPNESGVRSVFIGANTAAGGPGQSNQIVIGDGAIGLGDNSVTLGNGQIALTALRGQVGVNTTVPGGQLAVQAGAAERVVLVSRGAVGQTASLFEAQASDGSVVASIGNGGSARFAGLTVSGAAGSANVALSSLGGSANATLDTAFDRLVMANDQGRLQQISRARLFNDSVWTMAGNTSAIGAGALGELAAGSRLGTMDANDLRIVTQGRVRAIVSSNGAISTEQDLTVNGITIGRGAGNLIDNLVVGPGALTMSTTGSGNVALGSEALAPSTASNSTAVGFGALMSNTTGSGGTAVGNRALASNTTGAGNTALGQRALQSNTTGEFNVAIGQFALGGPDGNVTGSRNVAVGLDAGRYLVNGSPNAGGENSIYLGAGSRGSALAAQNNQIVIGYSAIGLGTNTVVLGNEQIGLTALRGQVGVNTTAPGGQVAVHSADAARVGLISRGAIGQTASLFEAQSSNGTTVASIASSGSARFTGLTVGGTAGTPNVTLTSLGGALNPTLPPGFDRLVVADAQGRLQQVTPGQLIQNNVWLSSGNSGTASAGALGALATGNRLGTLDAADLRIVTDGRVRAIVSATGAISTEQDLTVNGITIGRGGGNRAENLAFGVNALNANRTSTGNIAIGRNTLSSQTGGGANVAVGDNALTSVVDAWGNVAVGSRALQRSTGGGSTAVGSQALTENLDGFGHVAVGSGALAANTRGDGNTALGYNALSSNTTGTYNVAIGYGTMGGEGGNVDGVLNVAVGAAAGRNVSVNGVETPNTSGNRSVFLGAYTHAGAPDQTNQIVIGHLAVGLGSNSAVLGNGQIALTRLNGQVGINTSAPGAQLQVDAAAGNRVGLIVRGTNTPSADLMRVQTGAATAPEVRIDSTGVLHTERRAFIDGVHIGVGTGPGVGNLVVGVNAMEGTTLASAQYNTAIGNAVMRYNRGQHNTALGYGVLGAASGASYNTAVGYRVLTNATGNNNVVVGYMSGDNLGAGNNNTVLGVNAARSLTSGGANVLVGFGAGEGLGTSYSNRLAIANNIATTLIYGEFDRGRLMVNAPASPGALNAALQVNTTTSTDRGLVVRGALGQSVNLFEVQDVGGSALVQITRDGRLGVGRAPDTGFQVDVAGDLRATRVFAGANLLTSDARFKTNITPVADALALVQRLQGVNFDWNRAAFPTRGFSSRPQIGVLAQQVETVLPQLVDTDAEGYKSVNYTGFIPVLIEGMKAQQGVLAQHAGRLDGAEALLQAHGSRLQQAEEGLSRVVERTGVLERGLTRADERIARLTERADRTDGFLERFDASSADSLVVRTPNLRVSNLTAERAAVEELVARRLEAEQARFQSFEADEGRVSGALQARSVNAQRVASGERELFVSLGTVAPLFEVPEGAHFQVTVSSRDGSFASATVLRAGGQLRVLRMAAEGIELVPQGSAVGVMAPSRTIKASWLRTG